MKEITWFSRGQRWCEEGDNERSVSLMELEKENRVETFRVAVMRVERQPAALMDAWSTALQTDATI